MKRILILGFLMGLFTMAYAQPPKPNNSEMQQMINEMKKEIAQLEEDIRKAEDPSEAEMLKKQLATYKSLLAQMDKSAKPAVKSGANVPPPKPILPQEYSPIVHVVLKQPVTPPAAGQDKDRYFWYRGKKVNDSTLITRRGTVVQYSKKRSMLIVEPDKKKDTNFVRMGSEIAKNEQRKNEMVTQVSKMKNGFTYYPFMVGAVARYDDIAIRYGKAVNNTIRFSNASPTTATARPDMGREMVSRGPAKGYGDEEDLSQWISDIFKRANEQFKQLPPIESFPAPPRRDLGVCSQCDTNIMKSLRVRDSLWEEAYQGKERDILGTVASAMHRVCIVDDKLGEAYSDDFNALMGTILGRLLKKDNVLIQRTGNDLQYNDAVAPVVLGHERQMQLMGMEENSANAMQYLVGIFATYEKYYKEQVAARNHDFVLDLAYHLGIERQKQLLGTGGEGQISLFTDYTNYNRFALTMEADFIIEDGTPEWDTRWTGSLAMKEKRYVMFIRDSCRFKMYSYTQDIENSTREDVLLEFTVNSGQKTYTEDGKKKTVNYSGPPSWFLRFPDTRIHFCADGKPDTMHLTNLFGDDRYLQDILPTNEKQSTYKGSFGAMANLLWVGYEKDEANSDLLMEKGNKTFESVVNALSAKDPGTPMGTMKVMYENWTDINNNSVEMIRTLNTEKSDVLFQAANRSSVLADTYTDTKRSAGPWEVKRGMTHLRIVHEPIQ